MLGVLAGGSVHGFAFQTNPLIEGTLTPVRRFRLEGVVDGLRWLLVRAKRVVLNAHRNSSIHRQSRS